MNLPDSFTGYTRTLMGDELFGRFMSALATEPSVSIRLNPLKCIGLPYGDKHVPWCPYGYYLSGSPKFTFDPLLHAGWYYVQEASSMFVHNVLSQYVNRPVLMLDLCAAPGGKSTAALGALPAGSMLISNEPVRQRAQILTENIQKWGSPDVIVTNNHPQDFVRSGLSFDIILCDVPCSGEGMFRKDEGAIAGWSERNVASCQALQHEIVSAAWRCMRPGGLLIYSTCTFNTKENEENVRRICDETDAEVLPVNTDYNWGITGSLLDGFTAPVYRFIPGCTRGEGLFCAVMRKGCSDCLSEEKERPSWETRSRASETATNRKAASAKGKKGKQSALNTGFHINGTRPAGLLAMPEKTCTGHGKDNEKHYSAIQENAAFEFMTTSMRNISSIQGKPEATAGKMSETTETIFALPHALVPIYNAASRNLRILSAGITLGYAKGRDIVPSQALALSAALRHDAFPSVELTYGQAVAYLRKESFTLPESTPRGFVLMTYRGAALGFMKNIGSRANNLYPQEWKIKSTHTPEEQHIIDF